MARALYGERGFFTVGGGAGRRGDFLTSPEVGPLFGAVLARALDAWWNELGQPDPYTVVEAGAGPGTLVRSILAASPRCIGVLRYVAVEVSPSLRARHPEGVISRDALPTGPLTGVVLANELLDNLPFDLRDAADREVLVDGDRFTSEPAYAVQTAAAEFVRMAIDSLERGRVVAFDYTTTTAEMRRRPYTEWLRTYRGHERGGHPLDDPGHHDITADVALDQLPPPAARSTQADFLRRHGIDELVDEGRRVWRERAPSPDLAALTMRSRVREAEALCDTAGLGAFDVLEWIVVPRG